MDTRFLHNSLNTLIVSLTVLILVCIIVWTSLRRNVTITKQGLKIIDPYPYDIFSTRIPAIDDWLKDKLRTAILENVDSLFGMMSGLDPIQRQTLLLAVLDEINQRISINGFAKLFSNQKSRDEWKVNRKQAIMCKVSAHKDDLKTDVISRSLDDVLEFVQHEFALRTKMACEKKLLVYEKYLKKTSKVKQLYRKNENYIEELKKL